MSDTLNTAVDALNQKLPNGFDGAVKFAIEGEGSIIVNDSGAKIDDGEADCTLTASVDTFQDMMSGDLNPTAAFMSGRLKVDGDMGAAMKLGALLA